MYWLRLLSVDSLHLARLIFLVTFAAFSNISFAGSKVLVWHYATICFYDFVEHLWELQDVLHNPLTGWLQLPTVSWCSILALELPYKMHVGHREEDGMLERHGGE